MKKLVINTLPKFIGNTMLLVLICVFYSNAQIAPGINWQKNYGGSGDDGCEFSAMTPDGGYILGGNTGSRDSDITVSFGYYDWWVVKTDVFGVKQWQKSYGGSQLDFLNQVKPDINGGYILVGYTYSNDGDVIDSLPVAGDAWIVKIDDTGKILWQKVMGTNGYDCFLSVNNTPDSGYVAAGMVSGIVGGSTYYGGGDLWVVKFDKTGSLVWQKNYGGSQEEMAFDGVVTQDHGFIFCGYTKSSNGMVHDYHGGQDAWVLKLDSVGNVQWNKTFGGSHSELAESIKQNADGSYVCAIQTNSTDGEVTGNHGGLDYWIVVMDDTGKINWSKCYGGSDGDYVYWIIPTFDNGYAISGTTYSSDSDVVGKHGTSATGDYWLVKINDTGKIMWTDCIGGTKDDEAGVVMQSSDSSFAISGFANSSDGDATKNYDSSDYWLVKLNKEAPAKISVIHARPEINVYPTLTTDIIHIEMPEGYDNAGIYLSDNSGKRVTVKIPDQGRIRDVHIGNLSPGLYYLNIFNKDEQNCFKVIYSP